MDSVMGSKATEATDEDGHDRKIVESGYTPSGYEYFMTMCGFCRGNCGMLCCCACAPYKEVPQGYVGLITKFGRFDRKAQAGLVYINPCTESLTSIDTRLIVLDLARQNVTTADNLSVNIDCVLGYRIIDSNKAQFSVNNVQFALTQFCFTTLRHIIGTKSLQECLASRDHIAHDVKDLVNGYAAKLGVEIESIGFRDMVIPSDVQHAISAAAIARRNAEAKIIDSDAEIAIARKNGEAKIIAAEADVKATQLLAKAAESLNNHAALHIRTLKTMEDMAKTQSAGTRTIVIPMDMSSMSRRFVEQQIGNQ
jgi:erythrocyte band 7 integral membrane protein